MAVLKKGNGYVKCLALLVALFMILPNGFFVKAATEKNGVLMLQPGGMCFGVQMSTDGALVVGFSKADGVCPAEEAGIARSDLIVSVDGEKIKNADDLITTVDKCGGKSVKVEVVRAGEHISFDVTPRLFGDGKYKIGVFVRDDAAGIGTVTFIDPETGAFGGLGHGIYDIESETLIPMSKGIVNSVNIKSVRPGKVGIPGELKGCLEAKKIGKLTQNTEYGVFGYFTQKALSKEGALPIARKTQVKPGKAQMICTTDDVRDTYEVEITEIHNDRPAKNYVIKITDRRLLEKTGGIVQGMSGSPIIQDGRIVGALTHVLVRDPSAGYGIFIGNMLSKMTEPAT